MKELAIAIVAVFGLAADLAILAAGAWLTFFLGFSFWWWVPVLMLSLGETVATYKLVNAVNGKIISITD